MKLVLWMSFSCAFAFGLVSCGNNANRSAGVQQPGTGPFDARGNYVEEWADNPAKWRKPGAAPSSQNDEIAQIPQVDLPPMNSVPLVDSRKSQPKPTIAETKVASSSTKRDTTPVVVKARPQTTREGETPVAKSSTKPKSKTPEKTKVAEKPKSSRYVVKSGDSLSAIASRNGTSVSAIQRANGISGSMIRPGQSLTIPKR